MVRKKVDGKKSHSRKQYSGDQKAIVAEVRKVRACESCSSRKVTCHHARQEVFARNPLLSPSFNALVYDSAAMTQQPHNRAAASHLVVGYPQYTHWHSRAVADGGSGTQDSVADKPTYPAMHSDLTPAQRIGPSGDTRTPTWSPVRATLPARSSLGPVTAPRSMVLGRVEQLIGIIDDPYHYYNSNVPDLSNGHGAPNDHAPQHPHLARSVQHVVHGARGGTSDNSLNMLQEVSHTSSMGDIYIPSLSPPSSPLEELLLIPSEGAKTPSHESYTEMLYAPLPMSVTDGEFDASTATTTDVSIAGDLMDQRSEYDHGSPDSSFEHNGYSNYDDFVDGIA